MTTPPLHPVVLRLSPLLAILAGALTVLAFAPFRLWPVQIATLAFVFWLVLRQSSIKRGMLIGWAYGFGWTACGIYWLYISMHRYGGLPSWMAVVAVAALAMVLGAFAGLAMGSSAWFRQRGAAPAVSLLVIFPALWMLSEWLRGWVLTGFPWIVSGYAHTDSPLAGYAPVVGVYGIGWLAAMIAGSLVLLQSKKLMLVPVVLIIAAGIGLKTISWTTANGQPISVRLLQGNIAQEMKFANDQIVNTLALYHDMVHAAPANLIATPETALPLFAHQLPPDYLERLSAFARQSGSHIALGIPVSDSRRHYANSVIGIAPQPEKAYRYDKHHLVPFGEFIPAGARWFVNMMNIPLGDFSRGAVLQAPFQVKDQWVMPNICYEDLFGEEIADQLADAYFSGSPQATMLLNLSNIAWFGDSIALPQHLQISQMRALETRRPMLRATNSGTTAVIDSRGKVVAQLPPFTQGTLTATVQGYTGWTPYILIGNTLIVVPAFLILAFAWFSLRKKGSKTDCAIKTG
ncbi:MAG: apolipoprotein N-acyltransferase [Burkholderiales bacterium RIFCSPLOWO2_02_FULL_57_36]|nr:MAG: apolipoprotein N-acyltransferase [Burkholderiales bacterium RIFCSPLOWO2_02_FULL_57_36]